MDRLNHVSAKIDINKFDFLFHHLILFIIEILEINEACIIKKHKFFRMKFTDESKCLLIGACIVNLNPGIEILIMEQEDHQLAVRVHCLFS